MEYITSMGEIISKTIKDEKMEMSGENSDSEDLKSESDNESVL